VPCPAAKIIVEILLFGRWFFMMPNVKNFFV
jgi:hypothetical protein